MVNQAIQNAVVCMDLNANNACDAGEPVSARTGATGAYSLSYDPSAITAAQVAATSLIAPIVPGALTDATTSIDAAHPAAAATDRAYVLKQVPGKSGQINPLTTLVTAGVQAGLTEAVARTNAAAQLAIAPAKIDHYQDDPVFNRAALADNARLMAMVTADALKAGASLAVSDLAATSDEPSSLRAMNYTDAANYYIRTPRDLAAAAGATSVENQDLRSGLSAGTPLTSNVLYPSLYLTPNGWTRCTEKAIHTFTRGLPSRDTYCGVSTSVGYNLLADISGQTMASVVTAMQADSTTNTINNGISSANLLAALGTTTFPANAATRVRASLTLTPPIFINNSNNDARPQSEATTLEQLIAAKPAKNVNLATSGGTLSLGLSTAALRNLRVAFTGTTSPTTGTVQFYDCDLNTADQPYNCSATQTGTYTISTLHGVRLMSFAGHAATTYSTQVNYYAEVKGAATGDYVFRARQTKPTLDANIGGTKRLNATAWAAMKAKLGL
jgi:hypothetical protein